MQLHVPFLCEKPGAIAPVLLGLMAGWLADEIVLNLEFFKISYILDIIFDFLLCLTKVQCYYNHTNAF